MISYTCFFLSLIQKYKANHNFKSFNSRIFLTAFLINNFKNEILSSGELSENESSVSNLLGSQSSSNNLNSLTILDQLISDLSIKVVNKYISLNKNISFMAVFPFFIQNYFEKDQTVFQNIKLIFENQKKNTILGLVQFPKLLSYTWQEERQL